jgi:lipopolysaccharide transport system permease protein
MLLVYAFVFGTIMNARFGISKSETTQDYALALFCGLNLFNLCAEVIGRSPTLILGQPNLVKKVVFPLEILPVVTMLDALIHALLAFVPLFLGLIILRHEIPWSFVFLPFSWFQRRYWPWASVFSYPPSAFLCGIYRISLIRC